MHSHLAQHQIFCTLCSIAFDRFTTSCIGHSFGTIVCGVALTEAAVQLFGMRLSLTTRGHSHTACRKLR